MEQDYQAWVNVFTLTAGAFDGETIYYAQFPEAELQQVQNSFNRGRHIRDIFTDGLWSLRLDRFAKVEVNPSIRQMYIEPQHGAKKEIIFPDRQAVEDVFGAMRRQLGPNWKEERTMRAAIETGLVCFACVPFLLGCSGLLYWGVGAGWITRGPAWLAGPVNLFGPVGILGLGVLLSIIAIGLGAKFLLIKNEIITITSPSSP